MNLSERYFRWVCRIAMDKSAEDYDFLLRFLFNKNYRYTHPRDANRESDGIDLRYRYGYLNGIASAEIACELDDKPCSLLEVMVALAIRCEENVLHNFDIGDRTSEWFKEMIQSLGIDQNNDNFDPVKVDSAIERFYERRYLSDGSGSLFTLKYPPDDMRRAEIWDMAMWWADEQLNV